MDQKTRNRDLFIVDNSVSGWTALHYLEEWTEIANKFDIATGHFEVGALHVGSIQCASGNQSIEVPIPSKPFEYEFHCPMSYC